MNIPSLGFSCPNWLLYVEDTDRSVFVGRDSDEYADRYIQTLDFLITTGGRDQALKHDIYAAVLYGKRIHFLDIISAISQTNAAPSATLTDDDGQIKVENAARAMLQFVSFASQGLGARGGDLSWDGLRGETAELACEAFFKKKKVPAETRFGVPPLLREILDR